MEREPGMSDVVYYEQGNIRISSEAVELAGEVFRLDLIWRVHITSVLLGWRSHKVIMRATRKRMIWNLDSVVFLFALLIMVPFLFVLTHPSSTKEVLCLPFIACFIAICFASIVGPLILLCLKKAGSHKDVLIVSGTFGEAKAFYLSSEECAKCIAAKIGLAMREQDAKRENAIAPPKQNLSRFRRIRLPKEEVQGE
jgi:hypothetical protein